MHEYESLVYKREETVDGIGPWYWLKTDTGAWDGPKTDWEDHHKHKWFTHVKDFDVCFQAGACQGMYPRLLSERFLQVYSFEPDPLSFYVANLNCQSDKIHLLNAAVGLESGTFTGILRSSMENVGMHKTGGQGVTPILSIDTLNLPQCGLIALDIEGYEIFALRGAVRTIQRCSPVIACECPSEEVRHLLIELGYAPEAQSVSDMIFVRA